MSAFQAVNVSLAPPEPPPRNPAATDDSTPTTPRPTSTATMPTTNTRLAATTSSLQPPDADHTDDATTPTTASFPALAGQKPLPESPFPDAVSMPEPPRGETTSRPSSQSDSQASSKGSEPHDVDMEESDDGGTQHAEEPSDSESVTADGKNKKKRSQRFFCTEYPPCNLSFTRSEHLARHIRKHTGERPFQCHCSRRFSRLDNLRQHAQTVHVNEEIPTDSLAATGTRFQRQVRTDRVRATGTRSRASTASQVGPGRGHTRNALSASSIGSIASSFGPPGDPRRRPAPLVMAADPRTPLDAYPGTVDAAGQFQPYRPHSPSAFTTPTSATFSTGPHSPRWPGTMHSPITQSRTMSVYNGHRTPGRRLSVPSGANPFQSPHGPPYGQPPLTPMSSNPAIMSPASSIVPSPTTSTSGSTWSRRDSMSSNPDEAWRRRTWHPETYASFSTRLANVSTPHHYYEQATSHPAPNLPPAPLPPPSQHPAATTRLPGIESFDPLRRPATPPRRMPSPMMIDTPSRNVPAPEPFRPEDRKSMPQWDMGLHRNLTRLEIAQSSPDTASQWASEAHRAVQAQAEHARAGPPATVRFEQPPYTPPSERARPAYMGHHHTLSAPSIPAPRDALKRQGWYNGPMSPRLDTLRHRTSPEDSSSSEGGAPGTPPYAYAYNRPANPEPEDHKMANNNMLRLETLVAVATSEENAAAAY